MEKEEVRRIACKVSALEGIEDSPLECSMVYDGEVMHGYMVGTDGMFDWFDEFYRYFVDDDGWVYKASYGHKEAIKLSCIDYTKPYKLDDAGWYNWIDADKVKVEYGAGQSREGNGSCDYIFCRFDDNSEIYIETTENPAYDEDGNVIGDEWCTYEPLKEEFLEKAKEFGFEPEDFDFSDYE